MQRAREERAAVADPRPGQAAPGGERGAEGAGLGRALLCGSTGTALGKGRDRGEAAPPERGPGVRCSGLWKGGSGSSGAPPVGGWEPAWLFRLAPVLLKPVRGLKRQPFRRGSRVCQGSATWRQLLAITCLQLGLGNNPHPIPGLARGPVS